MANTRVFRLPDQPVAGEEAVFKCSGQREFGSANGDFVVPDDFDSPLSDEILAEFER
jgi:hypothetical protein